MILTKEQIYKLFCHRTDTFAVQSKTGAYYPVKREITLDDIQNHLDGKITIGVYCLAKDNTVKWSCVDLDGDESDLRQTDLKSQQIYELFKDYPRIREFSGRRGYHVWIFFKNPVPAIFAKTLVKARTHLVGSTNFEIFPKQVELNEARLYGNLVKLIYAVHRVSQKRSEILDFSGL